MYKYIFVFMAQAPDEFIETPEVGEPTFSLFFTEGMYGHVGRQAMLAGLKTDDVHLFAMLGEFLYPAMEKPEYRMFGVDDLCDDEKFHAYFNQ